MQAARIAKRAADRVEDEIEHAPLPQAVVTFGVMTDKVVLLNNDPAMQIQCSVNLGPDPRYLDSLNRFAESLNIPKPDPVEPNFAYNLMNRAAEVLNDKAKQAERGVIEPATAERALTNGESTR